MSWRAAGKRDGSILYRLLWERSMHIQRLRELSLYAAFAG